MIRLKLLKERETGRKVVYSGDGYYVNSLYLDRLALRGAFKGEVPKELEITLNVPEEETEFEQLKRETDNDLRRHAMRVKNGTG